MNRFVAMLSGSVVAAGMAVGAWAHDGKHEEGTAAKQVTVTGELIDTACFVSGNGKAKGQDHAECARDCMASGVPAGILPQGSKDAAGMMFLLTNPRPLAPHAGKTIKVEGKSHAKVHAFDVKKLYVQNGSQWTEVQLQDEHHGPSDATGHAGHDAAGDHHKAAPGQAGKDQAGKQPAQKPAAGQRQR